MDGFFEGGGGVKNETRDLARGSLRFTFFLQHFFCHVLLLVRGGGPKCNLQFVTPVVIVCCILKA